MIIINYILMGLSSLFLAVLLFSSVAEKEKRASLITSVLLMSNILFWLTLIYTSHTEVSGVITYVAASFALLFSGVSLIKKNPASTLRDLNGITQFDERNHMFSRNMLNEHKKLSEKYYKQNPDKHATDRKIAGLPELTEKGSEYYDDIFSEYLKALDYFTVKTGENSSYKRAAKRKKISPDEASFIIKRTGKHLGAYDVAVTELRDYHLYTHAGRQPDDWGKKINLSHKWAVSLIIAMDVEMLKKAPSYPEIMETMYGYVEAAKIAHILANFIKGLGYDALAHYDANYKVACVPVAIDAGQGVLGRLGLLMHPVLGPCLRLAVVTTDMPLTPDEPKEMSYIESFCEICKKCADNCPSRSIESGEEPSSRGFRHWSVRQETCYSYWKTVGTDCGICIKVCPYTKPDTFIHKMVRFYISRNQLNRRIALFFDDLLYGRKMKIQGSNPPREKMI